MIFYYTDNEVSQSISDIFSNSGIQTDHIKNYKDSSTPIFYGILRGTGASIIHRRMSGSPFYYMDNGYYGASYIDAQYTKSLEGQFRIVKNDLIHHYPFVADEKKEVKSATVLLLPPSPYAAFMHNTTPEDWIEQTVNKLPEKWPVYVRKKDVSNASIDEDIKNVDVVYAFNSIGVLRAVELGKSVYDTYGIFRNDDCVSSILPYYSHKNLLNYYSCHQFSLEEISEGKWK